MSRCVALTERDSILPRFGSVGEARRVGNEFPRRSLQVSPLFARSHVHCFTPSKRNLGVWADEHGAPRVRTQAAWPE